MRSKRILEAVARKHKLQVSDILGHDRFDHFVAARREAILEMKAAGLTTRRIAIIMSRDYTSILHHTNPERRAYRRAYHARRWREKQAGRAPA
jgi:chromosomal replication initiation ATPase DnaA